MKLEHIEVNCGFKPRTPGMVDHVVYGREIRNRLYEAALAALASEDAEDYTDQFHLAEDAIEVSAVICDSLRVAELWLSVSGYVGGKYRSRDYASEL